MTEFETERTLITPYIAEHADTNLEMDMDPDVMRYIGDGTVTPREERRKQLLSQAGLDDGKGKWSVFLKSNPKEYLGWVCLIPLKDHHAIELGYRFKKDAWGKGFATEAARPLIAYGFDVLKLNEIAAVTHPENAASQNVLRKLGFEARGAEFAYGQMLPIFYLIAPST
ncbi:MAG: GNAT family N-acetyltransferase [Hyphomicrobiales bacterium]